MATGMRLSSWRHGIEAANHLLHQSHGVFGEERFVTLFADQGRYIVDDQMVAVAVDV